jgi:hypothetical protein
MDVERYGGVFLAHESLFMQPTYGVVDLVDEPPLVGGSCSSKMAYVVRFNVEFLSYF